MAEPIVYVDFSSIHLSKSEKKLLKSICGTPQRRKKEDITEDADHLREMGLIDIFENTNSGHAGQQGLFATALGKEYLEYAGQARRAKVGNFFKWIVPLIFSIAALVLSILAYTGTDIGSGKSASGSTTGSAVTETTPAPANTPAAQPAQAAPATPAAGGTTAPADAPAAPAGGVSGEPTGEPPA